MSPRLSRDIDRNSLSRRDSREKNIEPPISRSEVERRTAELNRQLIASDLVAFASKHSCVIPTSIETLYANHDLLTKRHFETTTGDILRWFCPLNDETHIHTHSDRVRYAIFACAGDGESFCFPLGQNPDDCRIRVLWDSGELDLINLTANDLQTTRPAG